MISKTELLNDLFDKWENSNTEYKGKFVKDGIIDEQLYSKAPIKILIISKEPNNPNQEPGDFREWWNEQLAYAFSHRIAEWCYGLFNNFPQYDNIIRNKSALHNVLKQIAIMNIKKVGGSGNSVYHRMMDEVRNNFSFIHSEIDIIEPEIIITGISWRELRDELFPSVDWTQSGYDIEIGRHNNSKVIDFYHPSSRTGRAASYSLLQNIVNSYQFKRL